MLCSLVGVAVLWMLIPVYPKIEDARVGKRPWESWKYAQKELPDYINANSDNTYFLPVINKLFSLIENCGVWETIEPDYCNNLFYLGGWDARLPYKVSMLFERGITNPTRALLENNSVYTIKDELTTDFLRRNYGAGITISGIAEAAGTMFVQYTPPVPDAQIEQNRVVVTELDVHEEVYQENTGWRISGTAEQAKEQTLYCNVTIEGIRSTYRVKADENGEFTAFFYDIPPQTDWKQADILFYKATNPR